MTGAPWMTEEAVASAGQSEALGLVLLRVRLLARRRLQWLNSRAMTVNGHDPRLHEIDALLNDVDDPAAEAGWAASQSELNARIAQVERALDDDSQSRLATLIRTFALDEFDRDLLQVCLAAALDPNVGRLYAYLHDDSTRAHPSLYLVARLCGYGRFAAWKPSSPLRRWAMIEPAADPAGDQLAPCLLDPVIRDWLSGDDQLDPLLIGRARLAEPFEPLPEWEIERAADFVAQALADDPARTVVLHIAAPPGSGRKTFAADVAARLGMPLLVVRGAPDEHEGERLFVHAQRHAFLHKCALAWDGPPRRWSETVAHFPLQFVIREPADPVPQIPRAIEHRIDLAVPATETRLALWSRYAPAAAAAQPDRIRLLAERFSARPGVIAAAAGIPGAAVDQMAQALRGSHRELLGGLTQHLETPFGWDDLIVSEGLRDALQDFVHEANDRTAFWEQPQARRLFPHGRGLAALFTGVPGTGKTMAAQVIAAELGLDLFRIDLSTVVSKYVGETSHNLQRIIARAAEMDVVLFFDEADALFSRRTEVKDAHDRFANTDTNHLLQAIENYSGIAVLATNRKANIDPAFLRRLRYVMEFAKPDASQRWGMWTRFVAALAGQEALPALRPALERLAAELDLTGAQIKYAVLSAVFAARRENGPLRAAHLLRGLDRELGKEGRALNERERARLE